MLDADAFVEIALELLHDDYGDPEDWFIATDKMTAAAKAFVKVVEDKYVSFMCEKVKGKETIVDIEMWLLEHAAKRLEDPRIISYLANKKESIDVFCQ